MKAPDLAADGLRSEAKAEPSGEATAAQLRV